MLFLKQSTAQIYRHGPFVDEVDGFTAETGLTINQADIQISKNGSAFAQTSAVAPITTHDTDGFYQVPLTTVDTNTLGQFKVQIAITGARIVTQEFMVLPANIFDSFVLGTDFMQVDMVQVSGDSVAADNLELQYDGTGLNGINFPATQQQVQNIANIGGAEVVSTNTYVLTTGTLATGTVTNLLNEDLTYHIHTSTGGVLDLYYDFDLTGKGRGTGIVIRGYVNGTNDAINVQVYNWVTASYVQVAIIQGSNATVNLAFDPVITSEFTGETGAPEEGIVRIRFVGTGLTTATLALDQLVVTKISIPSRLGYTGDLIWIDTASSNTGNVVDVDGTESNPVNNFTDAQSLFTSIGAAGYGLFANTSIILTEDSTDLNFKSRGSLWNLNMNGQIMTGASVERARVSGVMVNTGNRTRFEDQCVILQVTLGDAVIQEGVLTSNVITLTDGAIVSIRRSVESAAGICAIDYALPTTSTELELYDVIGSIELRNMNANSIATCFILGFLTVNASCVGGAITIGPDVQLVDNSGGAVTITRLSTNPELAVQIPAIKTATDRLTFTNGNDVDVNIKSINGNDITGGGNTPAGYV